MNPVEKKILQAFSKVRADMNELQQTIAVLTRNQENLMQWIYETRKQIEAKKLDAAQLAAQKKLAQKKSAKKKAVKKKAVKKVVKKKATKKSKSSRK